MWCVFHTEMKCWNCGEIMRHFNRDIMIFINNVANNATVVFRFHTSESCTISKPWITTLTQRMWEWEPCCRRQTHHAYLWGALSDWGWVHKKKTIRWKNIMVVCWNRSGNLLLCCHLLYLFISTMLQRLCVKMTLQFKHTHLGFWGDLLLQCWLSW